MRRRPGFDFGYTAISAIIYVTAIIVFATFFITAQGPTPANPKGSEAYRAGILLPALAALLTGFALLLGLANLARVHLGRIQRQERNWPYSVALLLSAVLTVAVGTVVGGSGPNSAGAAWIFNNVYQPLGSTFYSLLAFFIAAAAFRALRARTVEMTILTVVALIVVLGQAPVFQLDQLNWMAAIKDWIVQYPALAAIRGIALGVSLGIIATSARLLLGIDRQYLS
ncbi:MAG: hypothetical protein DLM69_09110 [Candidatus Chloroheliales bacterium]|nr:MAG: hypothetical protein DLM69_09110 [Chloroflexota bacterium]